MHRLPAWFLFLVSGMVAVSAVSCSHYSTTGRLPQHIKTVYIPTFENETAEFSLAQEITDAVTERFLSEANLRLGEAGDADAQIEGKVRRYYEEAETFRQTAGIEVSGRRVTIVLEVEFVDRVDNKTLWQERNFSRWAVYEPDKESEQEAARRVVSLLADDLISSVLQQW
ncbi:MAG: LptE family protein [Candidatus Glassbacteria bacterium]|nr:LptE family protein [Candidatus Glassbacteria bacterium]